MDFFSKFENITFVGNDLYSLSISVLWFVGSLAVLKVFQLIVLRYLQKVAEKTKTQIDDTIVAIIAGVKPPVYFVISVYVGYRVLDFGPTVDRYAGLLLFVVLMFEAMRVVGSIVELFIDRHVGGIEKKGDKKQAESMLRILKGLIMVTLSFVAMILILSNYGVNVSSVITSFGIGGLAIALAVQNILSDIFSSFSIFIDKPFQVGDYISIGTDSGTVERIGLKTTRIRTLLGEELVVSNKELTTVRIQNFKKLKKRRVLLSIGVVYGTKKNVLEEIPQIIETIVMAEDGVEFGRSHLKTLGDSALVFETVYFVEDPSFELYMSINHKINLSIYDEFMERGIEFAYPTQTVHMAGGRSGDIT